MEIIFSSHALRRMKERKLTAGFVANAINFPDKIEKSTKLSNRFIVKKIYFHRALKQDHLLLAICERGNGKVKVITVIDTSKISKYF